ncbi:MAG TPA: group 1 truncated hemoglobin [Gemmatimonadaceae bacterium]|nr:group 1 truncated hemoglobin [Gemmatimonadaceae bacterium]
MRLTQLTITVAATLACARTPAPAPAPVPAATSLSLYKRLGGYDALAAVTDDFMHRIHGDTAIMAFFAGLDSTALKHIRQMVVDQLCAATGGPCFYAGKSMKETHMTLDITDDAFNRFIGHFQSTLTAFKVPSREQNEVMGALLSMKTDIVKKGS